MRFLLFLLVLFGCRPVCPIPAQWAGWYDEYYQWRGNRTQSE